MDLTRLEALRGDMEKCFRCSLCKMVPLPTVTDPRFTDACPAARLHHFHGYSGSGKQIMALALLDGRIQPDPALARVVFACLACGYCDVACKFIMDAERHRVNMRLRELLVEAGLAPPPLARMVERMLETGAAHDGPRSAAGIWAEGLGLKTIAPDPAGKPDPAGYIHEAVLLAGCSAAADPDAARVARKLAQVLRRAEVDFAIFGDAEPCCGLPAYWAGFREAFTRAAETNAAIFDAAPTGEVIVTSGSCLGAIRSKYPEYDRVHEHYRATHATEFLVSLLDAGRLKLDRPVPRKVTYHDPCYLGRQSDPFPEAAGKEEIALGVMTYTDPPKKINFGHGVYDPPRRLLRAIPGLELREMWRVREYSYCCGGGGGAPLSHPELADAAARHRLEEARATGAEVLVTACHHCRAQLRKIETADHPEGGLQIVDVIDLVHQAAGTPE